MMTEKQIEHAVIRVWGLVLIILGTVIGWQLHAALHPS
jgi:uncharacterized protein YjeT (DUF2065 family)